MQHKRTPMQNFLLLYLPLFVILLFLLFPFYWTFVTSIKPEAELYGSVVTYWPHNHTDYPDRFDAGVVLFLAFSFCRPKSIYGSVFNQ